MAFNAVVNPFCMVFGIAEYVYALVYRLVYYKFALNLIILATFADTVIYRCVAVAIVPIFLGVCAKGC